MIKKTPIVFSITKKCFDRKPVNKTPLTSKTADKIKGILKPIEYKDIKSTPLYSELSWAIIAKMDPNMGPIQGVHPNAKVRPKTYAARFLLEVLTLPLHLHSLSNIESLNTPRKWVPNITIKTPDKYLISFL